MPLAEKTPEPKVLRLEVLGGLQLEGGEFGREGNSFVALSNFELVRGGTIRHARGFQQFGPGPYTAPIVAIRRYLREPAAGGDPVLLGLAQDGRVFNLVTGFFAAELGTPLGFPSVFILPTFSSDSNVDPNGAVVQQIFVQPEGGRLLRYDGANIVAPVGVSAPTSIVQINGFVYVSNKQPDPGKHRFIELKAHRRYAWTYWNPDIRHESSMSPSGVVSVLGLGGYNLEEARWYLAVSLNIPAGNPPFGSGYTRRRLYATQDGGAEYFLIEELYDEDGNIITDEHGSFSNAHANVIDGRILVPQIANRLVFQFGNGPFTYTPNEEEARSPFANLVQGAETTETSNHPPEPALFGAVYQNRLWLAPTSNRNKIIFSKVGEFSSFPVENFFTFLSDDADPIVGLRMEFASLIVIRSKKLSRITGTDFTDFATTHLEQGLGGFSHRLCTNGMGKMYYLSQEGIFSFAMDSPRPESVQVKPLFTKINKQETARRLMMQEDMRNGIVYTGLRTSFFRTKSKEGPHNPNDGEEEDVLLGLDYSEQQPFFVLRAGPLIHGIYCLDPIEAGNDQVLYAGMGDRKVYRLDRGSGFETAAAVTQQLTGEVTLKRKVWHFLNIEDDPSDPLEKLEGFLVSFSVDGEPFRGERKLLRHNDIGLVGRTLQIRIRHEGEFFYDEANDRWPTLSNMSIEYIELGESL